MAFVLVAIPLPRPDVKVAPAEIFFRQTRCLGLHAAEEYANLGFRIQKLWAFQVSPRSQ